MRIRAFHGLRYNGTAESAGVLAAPPYDQINDQQRDVLHRTDHHFSHLIRPAGGEVEASHRQSAQLHTSWLADGILVRDPEPGFYANSIEPEGGEIRFGLTALIDLEEPAMAIIRPHEETVAKTVAERLSLLRTTQIDYEPILLLADDQGQLDQLLAEDCSGEPLAAHVDEFGNTHKLYRIDGRDRGEHYRAAVGDSYALIADGHHRYKTAGLHAAETDAARGSAAGAKLGVITSLTSTALSIDPIHRGLPAPFGVPDLQGIASDHERREGLDGAQLAERVAEAPQPTLAVLSPDGQADIWRLDPRFGPDDLPPAASELSVVLLHRTIFPLAGLEAANATDGTVQYRSSPQDLAEAVLDGQFAAGIFLPPMTPAGFAAAVADGDVLPPKSTRFLPKVVSGLVWAAHADPVV